MRRRIIFLLILSSSTGCSGPSAQDELKTMSAATAQFIIALDSDRYRETYERLTDSDYRMIGILIEKAYQGSWQPEDTLLLVPPSNELTQKMYRVIENTNAVLDGREDSVIENIGKQQVDRATGLVYYYRYAMKHIMHNIGNPYLHDVRGFETMSSEEVAIVYFQFCAALQSLLIDLMETKGRDFGAYNDVISRLPKFCGKSYYEYNQFSFQDLQIIQNGEQKLLKRTYLPIVLRCLTIHASVLVETKNLVELREISKKSILTNPFYKQYDEDDSWDNTQQVLTELFQSE